MQNRFYRYYNRYFDYRYIPTSQCPNVSMRQTPRFSESLASLGCNNVTNYAQPGERQPRRAQAYPMFHLTPAEPT